MKIPEFKNLLILGLLVLVSIGFWYADLLIYGLKSASGQFKILFFAETNEVVLTSPNWTEDQKRKIRLISDVKRFGVSQLGLLDQGNFEKVFDQKKQALVWVLTACRPYSFEEKKWNFPFIGNLSYKGFFSWEEAQNEAIQLKMEGWETGIGKVSGWSTLGWFKDPILSNMLEMEDGRLVALILHEMVHGTIYIGTDVDFSENLAEFIGNQGAIDYFNFKKDTSNLSKFRISLLSEKLVNSYFINYKDSLDLVYRNTRIAKLEEEKKRMIQKIFKGLFFLPIPQKEKYRYIKSAKHLYLEGNDYLMSFSRYGKLQDSFEIQYKLEFKENLALFISNCKQKAS